MKSQSSRHQILPSIVAGFCLLPVLTAFAEEESSCLEALIVSALRVPREASTITSAVTDIDPGEMRDQGILQLRDALNQSPGVISSSTSGQAGAPGTLFIRGTNTKYAQVVIDGMRLSDSNNQLNHVLGGTGTYGLGGIEILRGPQGAIYGGESIGGVIWLETPHGTGKPGGSTTFEAGSFDTVSGYSRYQGQTGDLSFHLSGGYQMTSNDAAHHDFHQADTALRIEGKVDPVWTVGATFRSLDSSGEDIDTSYSYDSESRVDSALGTLYATGKISQAWTARFHAGYYQESYDQGYTSDDWFTGLPFRDDYFSDLRAGAFSTDHEITLRENLRLLAGAFVHRDAYESTYSPDKQGDRYGTHGTLEWDLTDGLTATGSLRWEDYDAHGDELTWRFGMLYAVDATGTTFCGNVGTSFRAPTYAESYGSAFNPPNPDLDAESSMGWDFGIEQKLGRRHTLQATWFKNQITDQIAYPAFSSPAVNVDGATTTDGLEFALRGDWLSDTLSYRLAWTYLHESLPAAGMPKNAASATVSWVPTRKSLIGLGVSYLTDHSWGGEPLDSYVVTRLFGSYRLTEKVKLHGRIENILDEDYELFNGYGSLVQGPGTGFFAGITVDW